MKAICISSERNTNSTADSVYWVVCKILLCNKVIRILLKENVPLTKDRYFYTRFIELIWKYYPLDKNFSKSTSELKNEDSWIMYIDPILSENIGNYQKLLSTKNKL